MTSRTPPVQRRPRGAWWTTWARALCPALAVLLAAVVMCLEAAEHGDSRDRTALLATMTDASGLPVPAGHPAEHHANPAVHLGDCPTGDVCCATAVHAAAAVLAAPVQPMPAILPRMPDLPRRQGDPGLLAQPPPATGAPDLHVLQVLRT
ncbi:hypothetical protein [Streptomyces coeruleofuscus]|uniref:hypothetical protein n=1 Tax=Streptomyces coeruleofuscus TaxID=66879 RepID=UPI000A36C52C